MRLITRAISGLMIASVTLSLLGLAGWYLYSTVTAEKPGRRMPAREREFAVQTAQFVARDIAPVITAYGQVHAWTTLEIRAATAGPITELAENFRDGRAVVAGELLFRIDPETAQRRVRDAEAALVQARSERAEAEAALVFLNADEKAARTQLEVRKADLARKEQLRDKQVVTAAALDESTMAVSAAEQALAAKERAVVAGQALLERAEKNLERAGIALKDAERALLDTSYRAPFAGRLTAVSATLGRRVSQNEKLADLIDPGTLEVSFRIRNSEFARLIDPASSDRIIPQPIKARLDLQGHVVEVNGVLDRPAAVVDVNQGGRTVFARLEGAELSALRPGDFVTVEVSESPLRGVALVPHSAATEDGRMLIVGKDDRLAEVQVKIERRQTDGLIVSGFPAGESYVSVRMPYLGPGIKVKRQDGQPPADPAGPPVAGNAAESPSEVALSEDDRAALMNHVRTSRRMPEEYRRKALEALSNATAPRELVERLQRQIQRRESRS
jgi:multidrug resistance efflux pump